ncbi:hypothetical protein [Sulfurimonas sp.]
MKILGWLIGIIVGLLAIVYVAAFTSIGNGIVKPIIEAKVRAQTHLDSKLKLFHLSMSDFEINLELNKGNIIDLKGTYSLFSQSFDINYNVKLEELKTLQPLTQTQLQSSFYTNGSVKGDMKLINIDGQSDVAKSDTKYAVVLTDLNPTSIVAKVDSLDLKSLLFMLNQKQYAMAKVNLDVNFKNITPHKLDGDILLITKNGSLNSKIMKKDFNLTIPHTAFSMNLDAKLHGDNVDYKYILNSNLAKISSSGSVLPQPLKVGLTYNVNVKELALLKPISGADVRGSLRLDGKVNGTKEKMLVTGNSDLASSKTTFSAILKNFAPSSLKANIKGLKLQKLLYMVKQPHYADALLDVNVDIVNADMKNLKGEIKTKITKGLVDSKYITKAYKFNSRMPKTIFSAVTNTTLNKNIIDTKLTFRSTLANFDIKRARFNLKDASLNSDYIVKIEDLNRLYFATDRHLKGSLTAYGDLAKAKDLDFTAHSKIAGGKLDAKLHNDDFHADLNSLQTLDILDMLIYPKIFKSTIDADLDYNLARSKGKLKGFLSHGTFTKNQALDLVKKYAHINLYTQKFKGDVNAVINKEHILASLDLRSNTSSIKTKNTKLNSKTQKIDSTIDIVANKNPLTITLKGDIDSPKIGVNANKLIQKEATKALQKEASKLFKGLF